jgi:hypothetical protein
MYYSELLIEKNALFSNPEFIICFGAARRKAYPKSYWMPSRQWTCTGGATSLPETSGTFSSNGARSSAPEKVTLVSIPLG